MRVLLPGLRVEEPGLMAWEVLIGLLVSAAVATNAQLSLAKEVWENSSRNCSSAAGGGRAPLPVVAVADVGSRDGSGWSS